MESHGENHKQYVVAIIPARYASVRLPGKMLEPVGGKPVIVLTAERAAAASLVDHVIVATDDRRIYDAVTDAGFKAAMTSLDHRSGTDRIAEVARGLPSGTIVVNVQGDEPMISPKVVDLAIAALSDGVHIATTCEAIGDIAQVLSPNVVKVARDHDGNAIYFSRALIPYPRDAANECGSVINAFETEPSLLANYYKHTGIYVYRREYLLDFASWPQGKLERLESLEQLRAIERGDKIRVVVTHDASIGIDTADDLERVRTLIETN